ncbi:amino acid ABC transporter substrate-binding protein, PAAT family [Pseudomonas borbori]|uniref:Amino acid ABC transporter substrate-binding protein, PAAT family n=2 Tax=Pseudomonas borbori TaxID=289003 RepID=A0A1I5RUA7_9PSED|nr:amino acid ABC transporter substrate-binding protein, PAAT family [Pseudomonas borbori]
MKPRKTISLLLTGLFALLPMLAGADTLERVRTSNTFTLGYVPDLAPFTSEKDGKVGGYAIDLCLKIADGLKTGLGLADMQVRYQALSIDQALDAISSGKVDIFCTPSPETLERRKSVSYSQPVYTAGLSVVVRKNAAPGLVNALNGEAVHSGPTWRATINQGLANHSFATLEGGVTEDWVRDKLRRLGVIASLVVVDSHAQGVQRVAEGKVDAFFAERMLLQSNVQEQQAADELMVLDRIFEIAPVSMALERDDEDFRLLVDTVLSDLYRSGELEQLYTKYFGEPGEMIQILSRVYALP